MRACLLLVAFILSASAILAQEWVDKMEDGNTNFYEVQEAFNAYWGDKGYERGKGYKQYKRWEYFMEPRVYPNGERLRSDLLLEAFKEARKTKAANAKSSSPWQPIGPTSWESQAWNPGLGRVNAIVVDPQNSERIYTCTPSGGLWRSEDDGETWEPLTDNLPAIGVSSVAINPGNSDEIYISTGDGNGGDTYSIGVLKSTDGGETWQTTGLSHEVSAQLRTSKILMHPTDFQTLWVATSIGVYTTTDGGLSWVQALSDNIRDIEINPENPDIIYASGRRFYRSVDGGINFTQITNGVPPFGNVNRLAIAVTPADPDYVYMVAGSQENSGFYGLYRSTDGGLTFELRSNTPNILTYSEIGSGEGGQSWYDLAIAASPTNPNTVFVGGINVWRSSNGGTNWSIKSHWVYPSSIGYTHADIHSLDFYGNILYCGSDGGTFRSANFGEAWEDLSEGLQITQYYRIAVSATDPNLILTASQDNGTNLFSGENSYLHLLGGDGNGAAIDYTNHDIMYSAYPGGSFQRSINGGQNFSDFTIGIDESGAWVTPLELHPTASSTLFAAFENVWKKTGENDWVPISDLPIPSTLRAMRVAPSNPDVIYTSSFGTIFRTSNGGADWLNISGGLPNLSITAIEVDPDDDQRVWITMSGYGDGQKVYFSDTGGGNWQNESLNLPNIPVNCISYQVGTNDGLYIGTDVGVYYKDAGSINWASYNEALPNVIVNQILFHYGSGQVFIGTYGRGVWVNEFFDPSAALPVVNFSANDRLICQGDSVAFNNLSINVSENFTWYFEGGTPEFSEEVAPTITYNTGGLFEVKLLAANQNGVDSLVAVNYINVIPSQGAPAPFFEDFESTDPLENATWMLSTNNDLPRWSLASTIGYESSQSLWIDNFNNTAGNNDFLESTTIDLSQLDTAIVTFRVAYAKRSNSSLERLRVAISTDCGENWTFKKLYTSTGDLVTAEPQDGPFAPSGSGEWALMVVDNIQPDERTENFRVQFEFRSNGGNNIYVDDINIVEENLVSTTDISAIFASLTLFPNPANGFSRLELELANQEMVQIELLDILGRKVKQIHSGLMTAGNNGLDFSTQNLAPGIYNIVIRTDAGQETLKLVVEN